MRKPKSKSKSKPAPSPRPKSSKCGCARAKPKRGSKSQSVSQRVHVKVSVKPSLAESAPSMVPFQKQYRSFEPTTTLDALSIPSAQKQPLPQFMASPRSIAERRPSRTAQGRPATAPGAMGSDGDSADSMIFKRRR